MFRGFSDNVDTIITILEYPSQEIVASNDNWQDDVRVAEVPAHLQTILNASDSGVLVDLPAGAYTIAINSHDKVGRGTIVLDLLSKTSKIARFNTIASTGHADEVGFIIRGDEKQKVLILGLEHSDFNPTVKLEKQVAKVVSSDTGREFVDSNENWEDVAGIPTNRQTQFKKSTDAALLLDLEPTAYIATISDSDKKGKGIFSIQILE